MNNNFQILDVVALKEDLKSFKLKKGFVGTVVEIFNDNILLVEFSGMDGHVYFSGEFSGNLFLKLIYEPEMV